MKEHEGISGLFRSKLNKAEIPVRDDFWKDLQRDLVVTESGGGKHFWLSPSVSRIAVAASVALILGMASAAYWFLSSPEVRKQAFTPASALIPGTVLDGDCEEKNFPRPRLTEPISCQSGVGQQTNALAEAAAVEPQTMSVHFSITVSQQVYSDNKDTEHPSGYVQTSVGTTSATNKTHEKSVSDEERQDKNKEKSYLKSHHWAIKSYLGTALPKGDYRMPFTVGVQVEHRLNDFLSLETGLQYNLLHDISMAGIGHTLHTLAIPVKLDVLLTSNDKFDFYATAGGAVEKCVSGATDNSFSTEPIQLSVSAGLGLRYKLTNRIALFAEPTVSHHFDTDSSTRSLYTERPTNLNLLCGVRMVY